MKAGTHSTRTETILLLVILFAAAILRFYGLGNGSLTNDEFSALVRTEFNSIAELINHGIRVDAHPAGVQVFLYAWTAIAGNSEFALRFPFALAGILSVYFLYLLGRRWFGSTSGLAAAAMLAVLQLPVLYSRIARPYAPGLLFTLAAAYCWTRILFPKEDDRIPPKWTAAAFGLSLAACAYTHYFSMLVAGLIAAGGLVFVKKETWRPYVSGCVLAVILFLPHLGIFFTQLGYGGVGEWLGKPKPDFFQKFLEYCFNDSEWLEYLFAAMCIGTAALFYRRIHRPLLLAMCLAWFFLPYFIGHWYSVHINPVLQYSTLLFSFPFLLLLLTGFLDEEKTRPYQVPVILGVLACGLFTLLAQVHFYSRNQFGVFKELVSRTLEWEHQFGRKNLTTVYNMNNPKYAEYYYNKSGATPSVTQYYVADDSSLARFRDVVDSARTDKFIYGWSTIRNYPEAVELLRSRYPVVVAQDTFFNSAIGLYSRGPAAAARFETATGYENESWGQDTSLRSADQVHSGGWSENLSGREFSLTFRCKLADIARPGDMIAFEAWFLCTENVGDAGLVMSIDANDNSVLYASASLKAWNLYPGRWQQVVLVRPVPDVVPDGSFAKFYLWNPGRKKIFVDDLRITVREASYYR